MRRVATSVGVTLVALTVTGCGANSPTSPSALRPTMATQDFSGHAGRLTSAEVASATALSNSLQGIINISARAHNVADAPDLTDLAFQIWQDYSRMQAGLRELGRGQLPTAVLSAADTATQTRLAGLTGSEFDREYARAIYPMLQAHSTLATQQGDVALHGIVSNLRTIAQKYLILVRQVAGRQGVRL
jgi:hypothetical protein